MNRQERIDYAHGLREKARAARTPILFTCVMSTGIAYSDKSVEVHGDYKKIAHLFFSDLRLEVYDANSPLLETVKADAARIQAARGQDYRVSWSGQTITLGHDLK